MRIRGRSVVLDVFRGVCCSLFWQSVGIRRCDGKGIGAPEVLKEERACQVNGSGRKGICFWGRSHGYDSLRLAVG